jgi:stearoyl-CoA desaturase (delta-9 desaturase)
MQRIAWQSVRWGNSAFLISTFLLSLTAAPAYLWQYGWDWFQAVLFVGFFVATGLSVTLGYHRLFSHRSFEARAPVRLGTLLFGAAAFENSVLCWAADHRQHHRSVDQDDDPYDISKGFFHAHIGWILFRLPPGTSLDLVKDLQQDPLVRWQHRHYRLIAVLMGFGLPTLLGGCWKGWSGALGAFLLAGVVRVVAVHHMTFFINSLCHTLGRQPYSSRNSARDSAFMALFTFGEGYHNFHHEFPHDYRNGVKPWQFDPTKWTIWLLHRLGLARQLRRVPEEKVLLAEIAEQQRQLAKRLQDRAVPPSEAIHHLLQTAQERLHHALANWERRKAAYRLAAEQRIEASREKVAALRREFCEATERLRAAIREWEEAHQLALAHVA